MRWMFVLALAACSTSAPDAPDSSINVDASLPDSMTGACAPPNVLRYENPGCDVEPRCGNPTEDLCLRTRCSCAGKIIGGCDYYSEPWIDSHVPQTAQPGDSCSVDAN